jgi:phenylacetate-coenzyme A ligase PaaK-like adenylate-forming protein
MQLWDSLEFGAKAIALKSVTTKSREEVEAISRDRLRSLIGHACGNSRFWHDKLAHIPESGFELCDLPTSNKTELMENFEASLTVDDIRREDVEAYLDDPANLGRLFRDKYAISHTSGSQGQPLLLVQPLEAIALLFALQAARGNARSLNLGEIVKHLFSPVRLAVVLLKPGFYPSSCAFEYMPDGVKSYIDVRRLSIEDDDLFDRLADFRPTHITAYASVLHEIARAVESGQLTLKPWLEEVVNISERLMPQAREHYTEIFGAPIFDDYGMGECLFLTSGCRTSGGMHVNADWAILEVVDEQNQPVPPGQPGAKVLLTNLANFVQPIIRYEVGDIVTMATEPCNCGNHLPLIAAIDGRDSDVFHIETESGARALQPTIFELAIGRVLDAREYQIIQEDNNRFRIKIEPLPGKTIDLQRAEDAVKADLEQYGLGKKLRVEVEIVDRLTPDGDQKFQRIVCKVEAPAADSQCKNSQRSNDYAA